TGEGICRVPLLNKAKPLLQMLEDAGVKPEECAVIGNSVIDVPMFKVAGFSIAFNPIDEETIREGNVVIHSDDLRDILPYLI
ncbi:MAG: HAD hydrolase family protein, partial [Thermoplasmata archaeon]|nr:HAD hydrolase family protein [Thermoplasmata archaeon]